MQELKRLPSRDIGIAGGGIAGLALATLLARQGARVVVHDQLDAPRPLGSGLILQPVGLHVLDAIGVGDEIRALGAPIERLYGRVQPSGRIVLDVTYGKLREGLHGVAIHRGALFDVLLRATQRAGVAFEYRRSVTSHDAGRFQFVDGQSSARFDLIVDALGVRSPLSRPRGIAPLPFGALWTSLPWDDAFNPRVLEQRYRRADKMAGVLPIGRMNAAGEPQLCFFWSLKHTDVDRWRERGLDAWKQEVIALWPQATSLMQAITSPDQLIFARYAHGTLMSPVTRGLAHVGDSWHAASPQLGQGANMALLDALALARALARFSDMGEALAAYARARLWHIRLYQTVSWSFTPAYQSDGAAWPFVRDRLVAPVSRLAPAQLLLAGLVSGALAAPIKAIERHTSRAYVD